MLTRKQYLELTKLDRDSLSALKRRDQIPFPSENRNEYTIFDAFTFMMASSLARRPDGLGLDWATATNTVRYVGRLLVENAEDIEAGAHPDSDAPIYAAMIYRQGGTEPFCGTAFDFADAIGYGGRVMFGAFTNVSLDYAVLQARCHYNDIEIKDQWPDANLIPSFSDRREAARQIFRDAMARSKSDRKAK